MPVLIYFIASVGFGSLCYKFRWLSGLGSITASAFGFCLLWLGGWEWVTPLLVFFGSSSLLSKIRRTPRSKGEKKDDIRSATQVLANGGVAWMLLITYAVTLQEVWYAGFIGSLAAANADTWATEIGRLAGGRPRNILSGQLLKKGLSGGVTWQGTSGSLIGAALIGFVCIPFSLHPATQWLVLGVLAGMVGSLLDSIMGSAFQVKYQDTESGDVVEHLQFDKEQVQVGGVKWVTNDMVNVFCTFSGAVMGLLVYRWFV